MEINVQATMGTCAQFLGENDLEVSDMSVVIAPLKVTGSDNGKLQITSGCNMWRSCFNPRCWYSIANRQAKKS